MSTKARCYNRRGFIFPLVLILGVVILILAYALVFMAQSENKLTNKYVDYTIAEQIAEAGVEQALFYLKADKKLNQELIQAISDGDPFDFTMPDILFDEVQKLKVGRGGKSLQLVVSFEPKPSGYPNMGVFEGDIRIEATATYTNLLNEAHRKRILAVYGVRAVYMGIIAPDHGLFIREKEHLNYKFEDSILPSDLAVFNGDVYVKNGITAELSDWNMRQMIKKNELTWEEYYYMDHPPKSYGLADGGIDFLEAGTIEYERFGVFRQFNMFGQPVPKEPYSKDVRASLGYYTDEVIKLRPLEFYKDMAKVKLEPQIYSMNGNANHNRYLKDIVFEGERGYNSVRYNKVVPLYGYGDWRRAPIFDPNRYGPRSRKHDMSAPVKVDGITFIRGDVFLEGWFQGVGLLVVQGNVYLGGSFTAMKKEVAGHPSLLNVIVFEDPHREGGFSQTSHASFKQTGKIIIKPHPDNDWSQTGGQDPDPLIKVDAALYSKNGIKQDLEAWRDNWADTGSLKVDLKHNFVTETVNMNFLPHDLIINGVHPSDEFREFASGGLNDFLHTEISAMIKVWVVETVGEEASLDS